MAHRYPTFETGRWHAHAVNFYAHSRINRASWLRESASYLNQALSHPDAKFVLLSDGNPVVRRGAAHRLALFSWKDVESTVLRTVHLVAPNAEKVFGTDAYGLTKHADAQAKHWARSTQSILAPTLSLAYLGVLETAAPPQTLSFADEEALQRTVPQGEPYFALSLSYRPPDTPDNDVLPGGVLLDTLTADGAPYEVLDMRTVILTGAFDREDAAVVAYARSLIDWHERYVFCASCGSRQYSLWGGHKHGCASVLAKLADGQPAFVRAMHPGGVPSTLCASVQTVQNYSYPRTDPVIIVGIISADREHILLGRQKTWPKGFYSCIAGFVESGESLEEAVRREALEETGVRVRQVAYHSSQPWPFPANLIFGAFGLADQDSTHIRLDLDTELEGAFFASRSDVLAAVAAAEQTPETKSNVVPTRNGHRYLYVFCSPSVPPPTAIAHVLLAAWARNEALVQGKL